MSIRRSVHTGEALGCPIHQSTQSAWDELIRHPPSALLTHVSRPMVGAPVQPGTEKKNPFSDKSNLQTLVPLILVAFHESVQMRESSFMTLCAKITNLLQTSKEFDTPEAWYLVLEQLRMPLITNTSNSNTPWNGPTLSLADPKYPKLLFQFYCMEINYSMEVNAFYYSANTILEGWQDKILNSLTSNERFTEAVTAWVWVVNNYLPFNPQTTLFTDFLSDFMNQANDIRWSFFVQTVWGDVNVDFKRFNTAVIMELLKRRDETMETSARNSEGTATDTKTLEYLLLNIPLDKAAKVLGALVMRMSVQYHYRVYEKKKEVDTNDISLFYQRLLRPVMAKLKTFNTVEMYDKFLYQIGIEMLEPVADISWTLLNVYSLNIRLFLDSIFEPGFEFLPHFQSYILYDYRHDLDVKTMNNIMSGDVKRFPDYLLS